MINIPKTNRFALIAIVSFAVFGAGCSTILPRQQVARPVIFEQPATTNVVDIIGHRNEVDPVTGVVTRVEVHNPQAVVTPATLVTNWVTNDVVVVNPQLLSAIETGRVVAGFIPEPWGTAATGLMTLSAVILGWVARRQNRKLAAEEGKVDFVDDLIDGVESLNDPALKNSIRDIAAKVGVQSDLHKLVKERTE